jgi:hypothetical protein
MSEPQECLRGSLVDVYVLWHSNVKARTIAREHLQYNSRTFVLSFSRNYIYSGNKTDK